jgi:Fe-Mn family superoxide dismutase
MQFWRGTGGEPTGPLADAITRDFGGSAQFKEAFTKAAVGQFGSGWAWLVKNEDGNAARSRISSSARARP